MPFTSAAPKLIFENQAGRLLADAQGFARLEWLAGSADGSAVRNVFEQALLLLQRTGWGRLLVNQQHLVPFTEETIEWLLTTWFPRATHSGTYRWGAILAANDVFARLSMATLVGQARNQHPIHYQYFDDEATAVAWLLRQH